MTSLNLNTMRLLLPKAAAIGFGSNSFGFPRYQWQHHFLGGVAMEWMLTSKFR
jgi:hypothetical protein